MTKGSSAATGEPGFTETMQIGIVVRDLETTIQAYEDDFGIGPWERHQISSADIEDLREYGQPAVEHSWRVAVTMIGSVMWELIQPLDQAGIYARFLDERGEGIHHVALATAKFEELVAGQIEKGRELVGSGELGGVRVAYLATDQDLGVITEIFDEMPSEDDAHDQDPAPVPLTGLARQVVEGPNQAHLATLLPDGAPHSVPLWIGLEGDDIAFLTDPGSRKARNIEHDQRVAISVTDRNQPFTMAQIRGRVIRRIDGDEAWKIIDRISHKYVGGPYPRGQDRVVFLVRPEHVQSTGYA